jgi:hypothetical protein
MIESISAVTLATHDMSRASAAFVLFPAGR